MDELGRYSKVYRRIWRDGDFRVLSDCGKLLFLRLMTGPELGSIPGLLPATDAGLAASLGWTTEAFREAFGEVSRKPMAKADWKAGLIWLPKASRYNRPESPNVVRGWRREWPEIPECHLKLEAFNGLRAFAEGLGKAFTEAFREAFGDPSPNQEQEQEQEQDKIPVARSGKSTWITPYLETYGEVLNAKRVENGQPPLMGDDLAAAKDVKALCQYLGKRKPTPDDWRARVTQWLSDAWSADNGLTRLRDFAAWHQRQIRKPAPSGDDFA